MSKVTELERQGVGKKVAADMFGLALRSYQLKLQRLQESASEGGVVHVTAAVVALKADASIDVSHANSLKKPENQPAVLAEITLSVNATERPAMVTPGLRRSRRGGDR